MFFQFSQRKSLLTIVLFFILLSFLFSSKILAESELTVSIQVGDTIMTFIGRSSPNSQISFLENNSVLGTVTADGLGNFNKSLLSQNPGVHNYSVYVVDTNGKISSTINYSVALLRGTETTLSNFILPPTINISESNINKGNNLKISGLAVASSTITLFFSGSSYDTSNSTISRSDGYWEYYFNTSNLTLGDYRVYAKTSTADGYQSSSSEVKDFSVLAGPTVTPSSTTTSQSGVTPSSTTTSQSGVTPTAIPSPSKRIICVLPSLIRNLYDPNENCRVEKEEVYTVVKAWTEEWRGFIKEVYNVGLKVEAKSFQKCDLNKDNTCSLIDLSILLFYIES